MNHIVGHFEGTNIKESCFSLASINGRKIDYEQDAGAYFSTYSYTNGNKPRIVARGGTWKEFEGTVENFASCLLVHEWYGHGVQGVRDYNHEQAYLLQMQDPIFFPKTTDKFHKFVTTGYIKYNSGKKGK